MPKYGLACCGRDTPRTPRATGGGNTHEAARHCAAIPVQWGSQCLAGIGLIRPIPYVLPKAGCLLWHIVRVLASTPLLSSAQLAYHCAEDTATVPVPASPRPCVLRLSAACEDRFGWISAPFFSSRVPQAALKCSYRGDRVTRD